MFDKILVANRGEIAVRIMRTCREMGITTVAVYSEADKKALHVLTADEAVYLGDARPAASYLNMDKIIRAACDTNAGAIHPGYGFLAENAEFAEKCGRAGLSFIGPPANVIRDLGDKTMARRIMVKGGVPVIPGMTRADPDPPVLAEEAEKIGYPVLIKASAGGGGKGMRVVNGPEEMEQACIAASSEAASAFGDGSVYLEKYFERPRHIEFQILADGHGHVIHLLERECSIQRRYQKIIEETPSPAMTPELREEMGKAAVAAASAAGYVNAGTVEFLLDREKNFYFLEVNTRLQVEHPITEMVTGIDLVRWQIEIAAGGVLDLSQQDISGRGHAVECRIYAEDPENNFFPSPGRIAFLKEPAGPGIRNDCGIYEGAQVPVEYDPILSKLVCFAENRDAAIQRMLRALAGYVILGVKTPVSFLMDVLQSKAFMSGETFTDFIEKYFTDWHPADGPADLARIAFIADEICGKTGAKKAVSTADRPASPWDTLGNWRG
ncbi:MAG: acetyl-CoA carboxylase biotin carboxylase subunit [Deltaproteobacteria bacterium]|nr:MAG: acetyl-CoA carboxylase biotin carboxylase subunit [Deltaproteobacteria bacterium]